MEVTVDTHGTTITGDNGVTVTVPHVQLGDRLSKRAEELWSTLVSAFYDGDRWVVFTSPHTARATGTSLVWRGLAEFDPESIKTDSYYGMRIRVSESWLNDNGLTRGIRFFAGKTLNELDAISETCTYYSTTTTTEGTT